MNKEELKSTLQYHDNLYYDLDAPEISDEEYNALKDQYIELYGEYNYVPGEVSKDFKRIKHTHPITSLAKVNNLDDLRKEMKRLAPFVIEPKLDGLTVVGYPGTTMGAGCFATRGNGEYGEDITATALKIDGINRVSKSNDKPVRMEAFMFKSMLEKLNEERIAKGEEPFKNPRNAAAGMLRHKDASKVKGVTYMAYNIVGSPLRESKQLTALATNGFVTVDTFKNSDGTIVFEEKDIDYAIKLIEDFDREALDYEIDGLVIKSNLENSLDIFGSTGHHPKNAVAYKFPAEGKWTKLKDVTWQVGRTGKVTPVAEIEPVDVLGSTINRATLHNENIMKALKINPGCEVFVIKANDVIPAITEAKPAPTRSIFLIPETCPTCETPLEKVNDQRFCRNPHCKEKLLGAITHLAKRDALDIEGLSEETAKKLVDAGLEDPFSIFILSVDDLITLPGFAKKSAEKLYKNIQAARTTEFKKFLYAAALPLIGRRASEDIANHFGSWEAMSSYGTEVLILLKEVEGIGEESINSIKNYGYLWAELAQYVTPRSVAKKTTVVPNEVLTVVVTGTFMDGDRKVSRNEIEDMVKSAGHKTSGSVSKKTNIVLIGEDAGSKADKAKELVEGGAAIKIINSIDELKELL